MKNIIIIIFATLFASQVNGTVVRMETTLGHIDIELYDDEAPNTVQNFLTYVNDGDFDGTVFHRSVPGFVVQGGGFGYDNGVFEEIASDSPINIEAGISNTAATIAMARTSDPNSATSQWFFNLKDNSSTLDRTNSRAGYAVFGEVIEGMDVVNLISSLRILDLRLSTLQGAGLEFPSYLYSGPVRSNSAFTNLVEDFSELTHENFIYIEQAYVLGEPQFKVNAGISGGWYNPATDGQGFYFEMLPATNYLLAAWFTYDLFQPNEDAEATIGHPGHRWFTSQGEFDGNSFSAPIALARNGLFDSSADVDTVATGSMSVEFTSCFEAVVTYEFDVDNVTGTFPITRLSGDNVALCEALSEEAP